MDYNCGIYFPQTGEGYISFVDPADDSWIERHLEDAAQCPELNRAASRRPLPQNLFSSLPDPANRSKTYLAERAHRRALLENVFLGQPIAKSYLPAPPSPLVARRKVPNRRRNTKQNLLAKMCYNCGHSRLSSKDSEEVTSSWSRIDVQSYCSDGDLSVIEPSIDRKGPPPPLILSPDRISTGSPELSPLSLKQKKQNVTFADGHRREMSDSLPSVEVLPPFTLQLSPKSRKSLSPSLLRRALSPSLRRRNKIRNTKRSHSTGNVDMCNGCGFPIMEENMVSAQGSRYHTTCFRCAR